MAAFYNRGRGPNFVQTNMPRPRTASPGGAGFAGTGNFNSWRPGMGPRKPSFTRNPYGTKLTPVNPISKRAPGTKWMSKAASWARGNKIGAAAIGAGALIGGAMLFGRKDNSPRYPQY
jgi:hypothetical protein